MLGGHVMSHSDSMGWAPQADAGNLRLLATYGSKRAKRYPNVPTLNGAARARRFRFARSASVHPGAWIRRSPGACTTRSKETG